MQKLYINKLKSYNHFDFLVLKEGSFRAEKTYVSDCENGSHLNMMATTY
jgi:hypothetical protein